jgi:hypothetical protein
MASRITRSVPVTISDVLDGHVRLDLECLDRLYLHGYLARLQVGGQVIQFLNHRGYPVPSPACLQQIGDAFRRRVASFAEANHIPVVPLKAADRNIEVMKPYLARAAATGRSQVAAIGVAQEPQRVLIARKRDTDPAKPPQFSSGMKTDRRVRVYYFYLWDQGFGPAFIKICTYCPWPVKIWVNGHEQAGQQARKIGLGFTELPAGSPPARIRHYCRGSATACSPAPSRCSPAVAAPAPAAIRAGRPGRRLVAGTAGGPGRGIPHHRVHPAPPRPELLRRPRHRQPGPGPPGHPGDHLNRQVRKDTASEFKTKVITRGTEVTINASCKHSRIKQYLKDGRALRAGTVINDAYDIGCQRRLHNLGELQARARAINARLLETERAGQTCVLANPVFERIAHPSVDADGGELQPCDLATLGSRPWPAPSPSPCAPSPASPTGACAP